MISLQHKRSVIFMKAATLCLTVMALLCTTGFCQEAIQRHEDQVFPSPDGWWEVRAVWISDAFRRDMRLLNTQTGKSFFGATDTRDGLGPRYVNALWSPDSRFVAITQVYGRAAHECQLVSIQDGKPILPGAVWETAAPGKEGWPCCLLKEEDKKRWPKQWNSYTNDGVSFTEWLNDRDLVLFVEFSTDLKASAKLPEERLRVAVSVTLRLDELGKARIVEKRYETYSKAAKGTPEWEDGPPRTWSHP